MGILFAVQAVGSVIWAVVLPQFKNTKVAYAVSLIIGGVGFALIPFLHDQYLQFIPFLMIGAGWAAMLAMPFTFVTNISVCLTEPSVSLRLWLPSAVELS